MSRRQDERGVVAVVVAVFMSSLFFVLAAISVDVARWYMEIERVQKAADAGALAGVTHMPRGPERGPGDRERRGWPQRLPGRRLDLGAQRSR